MSLALFVIVAVASGAVEYRIDSSTGLFTLRPNSNVEFGRLCAFEGSNVQTLGMVMCRSVMGVGFHGVYHVDTGDTEQPLYFLNVQCTGAESSVDECARSDGPCTGPTGLGVFCEAPDFSVSIGSSNSGIGLLLVRPSPAAVWGTVCGQLPSTALGLLCAAAGHGGPHGFDYITVGGSGPRYIGDVTDCANATTFGGCRRAVYADCRNDAARGIVCRALEWSFQLGGGVGPFLLRPHSDLEMGHLCFATRGIVSHFSSVEARVACLTVGYGSLSGFWATDEGERTYYASLLSCAGNETTVERCPLSLGITCPERRAVMIDCRPPAWMYRIGQTSAILEIQQSAVGEWAGVCASGFRSAMGRMACAAMGFSRSAVRRVVDVEARSLYVLFEGCGSALGLENCTYRISFSASACSDGLVVALDCQPTWDYQLVGGVFTLRPNATAQWGTMCGAASAVERLAGVMCASVGGGVPQSVTTSSESSDVAVYMGPRDCDGGEGALHECPNSPDVPCAPLRIFLSCSVALTSSTSTATSTSPTALQQPISTSRPPISTTSGPPIDATTVPFASTTSTQSPVPQLADNIITSGKISAGGIAGIVSAVVVTVVAAIIGVYCVRRKWKSYNGAPY